MIILALLTHETFSIPSSALLHYLAFAITDNGARHQRALEILFSSMGNGGFAFLGLLCAPAA